MKFALAGGGTGGHAYPAIAVAERLREVPGADLVYYGTERGPEHALAVRHDIPFRPIAASQVRGRSPVRLLRGSTNLLRGERHVARWFEMDRPSALFATGGYAAAPLGRQAKRRGVPFLLFLPDTKPGWAVRFLQRYATTIACSVEGSLRYLPRRKTVVTGYPVRRQFIEATREEGIQRFNLDASLPTLLVAGGSLGSHHINLTVSRALRRFLERMQLIHVCGQDEEQWLARERERLPDWQRERYRLHAYTDEMAWAMAAADLAVTRAGASTLGELPAAGLPGIVIPGDFSDQHVNASYLVNEGAAFSLSSSQIDELEETVLRLMEDGDQRERMAQAMRRLAKPDAAEHLANLLQEMAA